MVERVHEPRGSSLLLIVVLSIGVGFCLLSIPFWFLRVGDLEVSGAFDPLEGYRTWELFGEMWDMLTAPRLGGLLDVESFDDFLQGPVTFTGFLFSYLLLLPTLGGLLLARRSALVLWLARMIWFVILVIGPIAIFAVVAGEGYYVPMVGFWFWVLGVSLVAVAPWCVSAIPSRGGAVAF